MRLSNSLQGNGSTALFFASSSGHTEAIKALLAASDIDVNHENVSLYLLIPLYQVLGGKCEGHFLMLSLTLTLRMMT